MADSDSSLSSPPATDDEMPVDIPVPAKATKKAAPQKKKSKKNNSTILSFFNPEPASPPRKKRPASPPHEYVPEDNPDIAFIVMFRSRFSSAFPSKCPHVGPQDIERGVADPVPSPQIESLLCALLGLVLNRKKPVEKGHYGRALEEAIQTQKSQWPRSWNSVNPLSGGRSFNTMVPSERINLLKTLVLWSLNQSEAVRAVLTESYKSRTIKDRLDTNITVSVQPWGRDGDKRRYWLIEGQDDTSFRIYRESNPALKTVTWWSVAGSIEELRVLAQKLQDEDGTREAKALSERMLNAIPRFEATEAKRKRREYRLNRVAAFARPEPGFSLYEGRTRGKRMKYTFSDEEDVDSDALDVRRSARQSGRDTPAAPSGPTVTASGRQVRSRATGMYGEALHSGQTTDRTSPATGDYIRSEGSEEPGHPAHRGTRAGRTENGEPKFRKHIDGYNEVDSMDDEDDATSWDGGDEDEDEPDHMQLDDDDEDDADESSDEEVEPDKLIVTLRYQKGAFQPSTDSAPPVQETIAVVPDGAQNAYSAGAPLSGAGAPRDPEPAPAATVAPSRPISPPAQQSVAHSITNGVQAQPVQQSASVTDVPVGQAPPPDAKPEGISVPTPPYNAGESTQHQETGYNVHKSENHTPQPYQAAVPAPL